MDISENSSIGAKELSVVNIFCDDFLFTIPNYQRPYSWEEEHCLQLLDDLHSFAFKAESLEDLPPYFLGSAVIIKKFNDKISQIVDGQQRLTTLTILLSALRYSIDNIENKATISDLIFQKGSALKGTTDTYRLKTRVRDQTFFEKLVQLNDGIEKYYSDNSEVILDNDAQRNILYNTKAFVEEFKNKKYTQEQLEHLASFIIQKCVIVIVSSTDEDMAFRIFNVLNDRGKDLTIADIIKSEILEKISENKQELYTQKWEDAETKLGIDNFKDFFSYLRSIYAKRKAEKSVLVEIRNYVQPSNNPENFIDQVLLPFTNAYFNILKKNYESSLFADEINDLLKKLYRVSHTDWIPSAIFFIAKNRSKPEKIKEFLIQLEKLTLGMEAMKTSLNERIDRYAKINTFIERNENLYSQESQLMLTENDREYIITTLTRPDIYGKRLVKPILAKIEEEMNDSSISIDMKSLNIEHILPQTPTDGYWLSRFDIEERINLTNNLGNLTLISVRKNSQAKNFKFKDKIEVYFKADGKASNLAMVNKLSQNEDWESTDILERNKFLVNLFLKSIGLKVID